MTSSSNRAQGKLPERLVVEPLSSLSILLPGGFELSEALLNRNNLWDVTVNFGDQWFSEEHGYLPLDQEVFIESSRSSISSNSSSSSSSSSNYSFKTVSKEELSDSKPSKNACFDLSTMTWVIFDLSEITSTSTSSTSTTSSEKGIDSILELWHRDKFITPSSIDVKLPFLPNFLDPTTYSSSASKWIKNEDLISTLVSNRGRTLSYSTSTSYPTIIPVELWSELFNERGSVNSNYGIIERKIRAVLILWILIDNCLFKGKYGALNHQDRIFKENLPLEGKGGSILVDVLGFTRGERGILSYPDIDTRKEEALLNRKRLIRCWIELGLWLKGNSYLAEPGTITAALPFTRIPAELTVEKLARMLNVHAEYQNFINEAERFESNTSINIYEQFLNLGILTASSDETIVKVYEFQSNPTIYNAKARRELRRGRETASSNEMDEPPHSRRELHNRIGSLLNSVEAIYQFRPSNYLRSWLSTCTDENFVPTFSNNSSSISTPTANSNQADSVKVSNALILESTSPSSIDPSLSPSKEILPASSSIVKLTLTLKRRPEDDEEESGKSSKKSSKDVESIKDAEAAMTEG